AFQRLAVAEFLAAGHQAGHFGFRDVEFLAAVGGKSDIGDDIVFLDAHEALRLGWRRPGNMREGAASVWETLYQACPPLATGHKEVLISLCGKGQASSPNLSATSAARASSASFACAPLALTSMLQPVLAASIISPMIEVPPTVVPSLETVTVASNRLTVWTNFAEARACRPRLLMIRRSRDWQGGIRSWFTCPSARGLRR